MFEEPGGKDFAKEFIMFALHCFGGSNAKMLEIATGLPPKVLHPLLAELMEEKAIILDEIIFRKI